MSSIGDDVDCVRSRLQAFSVVQSSPAQPPPDPDQDDEAEKGPPPLSLGLDGAPSLTLLTASQRQRFARLQKVHQRLEELLSSTIIPSDDRYFTTKVRRCGGGRNDGAAEELDSHTDEEDAEEVLFSEGQPHFDIVNFDDALDQTPSETGSFASSSPGLGPAAEEVATSSVFIPPEVALRSDPPGGWKISDGVPLLCRTVFDLPFDVEGAMEDQGFCCASCSAGWDYDVLMSKAVGGVIGISEAVQFCYYTGKFYCSRCQDPKLKHIIPARALQRWDLEPRRLCREAAQFLSFHFDEPMLCVSAVNPTLYGTVPVLQKARRLRQQLHILHAIGCSCPVFRRKYFSLGPAASSRPPNHKSTFIPEHQRYLIRDTEFWSLADLVALNTAHAPTGGAAVAPENCSVIRFLLTLRDSMVRHVGRLCQDHCYPTAAKQCPRCRREAPVFEYDVNNVVTCSKCHSVFHKPCWQLSGCTTCALQLQMRLASGTN